MRHHWFLQTADIGCSFGICLSLMTERAPKLPLNALIFAVQSKREFKSNLLQDF